jgi:hypothetical protein
MIITDIECSVYKNVPDVTMTKSSCTDVLRGGNLSFNLTKIFLRNSGMSEIEKIQKS